MLSQPSPNTRHLLAVHNFPGVMGSNYHASIALNINIPSHDAGIVRAAVLQYYVPMFGVYDEPKCFVYYVKTTTKACGKLLCP